MWQFRNSSAGIRCSFRRDPESSKASLDSGCVCQDGWRELCHSLHPCIRLGSLPSFQTPWALSVPGGQSKFSDQLSCKPQFLHRVWDALILPGCHALWFPFVICAMCDCKPNCPFPWETLQIWSRGSIPQQISWLCPWLGEGSRQGWVH